MSNLKIFEYQGSTIQFEEVDGKLMANATLMCSAFNERPNDWISLKSVKKYIKAITDKTGISENQLVITKEGSAENGGGTWIHERLILKLAQWLNVEFEIWCDEKLAELLRTGKVELKPLTQMQMLQQIVNAVVEQEQSIIEMKSDIIDVKSQIGELKKIQDEAKNQIAFVERSEEKMPELSIRDKVRKLVNVYAAAKMIQVNDVYNIIYNALYYRYHIAIKKYKKIKAKESYLEVAERNNFIDKVFIVASHELVI